ncbi:transposase [Citrobacter freundii]|uniref:transposase n=1 Tax=Citrobacter freundii TaxID=546 RepID=UPI001F2BE02D|nr:transposase [Citrobacter freundii]
MGFWKTAGKLAVEVAKDALSSARELKAIHDRLEDTSSAELKKITTDNGFFQQCNGDGKASGTKGSA